MLNKSDKTHINIYLPDELVLKLRAVSKELEITISKYAPMELNCGCRITTIKKSD